MGTAVVKAEAGDDDGEGRGPAAPFSKPCNCKKSRCLKLYCECFASGVFCGACNCVNCENVPRGDSAQSTPAGSKTPRSARQRHSDTEHTAHKRSRRADGGCFCKKSRCLKKYCECFEAGQTCGPKCRCEACLN
ncbi:hypothetical protein M885DRAFT_453542, partial [Pelagophyceae sp. CCMP2097]